MLTDLLLYKKNISTYLISFLKKKKPTYELVNTLGVEVLDLLSDYATSGKMARGSLFLASYKHLTNKEISEEELKIASSLELIQSALLIHDDIMDQDGLRRGKKTIHTIFAESAKKSHFANETHFGNSMAICIGDIAFFLAFELINSVKAASEVKEKLLQKLTSEIQKVGLAQMQDMVFGVDASMPPESTIINLYLFKTARYTFSLPLALSAILANATEETIQTLEKLGEICGILFQIKDDELDLFGDEATIGKPVGSDIKENKKTLFYYYLMLHSTDKQKNILGKIFGKQDLKNEEIEFVRKIIIETKTKKILDDLVKKYLLEAEKNLEKLPKNMQNFLENILLNTTKRTF